MRLTMRDIADETARKHRLTLEQMRSVDRSRPISWPRQEAIWRMVEADCWSLTQIGRFFRLDHTTVLYGARAHKARLDGAPPPKPRGRYPRNGPLLHTPNSNCGQGRLSQSHSDSKQGKVSA